jgi:hypothetical protein
MRFYFDIFTCIAALAAAFCWFMSAHAKVSDEEAERIEDARLDRDGDGSWSGPNISFDGADLGQTLARQSRWSRVAAIAAGLSALSQAISVWLGLLASAD